MDQVDKVQAEIDAEIDKSIKEKVMDIAELRNKLNNIAAELAEHDDVQQEDIAIAEDSYDFTTPGGHKVKDVKHARGRGDSFDDDDYYDPYEDDPYGVELDTPLGPVTAEWDGEYGRGTFGNIQASNKTLSAMINKIYDEVHTDKDHRAGNRETFTIAVGKAVDKLMKMGKDNPVFMRGESVEETVEEFAEEDDLEIPEEQEEVAEEEVEETVEIPIAAIAELMQLAGFEGYKPVKEFANSPEGSQGEPAYMDAEDQMIGMSGGLNGPKKMYPAAAGGDNPMDQEPREIEEVSEDVQAIAEVENILYKSYRAFLEEQEISHQEEN